MKAVFWLCIFCIGSAVNLPRWPSCVEKAQPELCLLEPTEELVSAWEGRCKQRERGWWEGSGTGRGSRGPAPHQPGSMREFSMPSQKPWWGHGHASLSLGREEKKLELGGAGMVQGWGMPGHMQWA